MGSHRFRRKSVRALLGLGLAFLLIAALASLRWDIYLVTMRSGVMFRRGYVAVWLGNAVTRPSFALEKRDWPPSLSLFGITAWLRQDLFRCRVVVLPPWLTFPAAVCLLGFVIRRTKPVPKGCCQGCGYDLRGSTGARCSECGRALK